MVRWLENTQREQRRASLFSSVHDASVFAKATPVRWGLEHDGTIDTALAGFTCEAQGPGLIAMPAAVFDWENG